MYRQMAIHFPLGKRSLRVPSTPRPADDLPDQQQMLGLPGIDQDRVRRHGKHFYKLIRSTRTQYETMMKEQDDDQPQDPNHHNVIELTSDDEEFGDPGIEPSDDEEPVHVERSGYFPSRPGVEEFNAQCTFVLVAFFSSSPPTNGVTFLPDPNSLSLSLSSLTASATGSRLAPPGLYVRARRGRRRSRRSSPAQRQPRSKWVTEGFGRVFEGEYRRPGNEETGGNTLTRRPTGLDRPFHHRSRPRRWRYICTASEHGHPRRGHQHDASLTTWTPWSNVLPPSSSGRVGGARGRPGHHVVVCTRTTYVLYARRAGRWRATPVDPSGRIQLSRSSTRSARHRSNRNRHA